VTEIESLRPLPRWAVCQFFAELCDLDALFRGDPTAYRQKLTALLARVEAARLERRKKRGR